MRIKYPKYLTLTVCLLLIGISCSESFLEQTPPGSYSESALQNQKGIEGLLIAAYSSLDGSFFNNWNNDFFNQDGGASNWAWGSVRGGDAYKGTEPNDGTDLNPVERHETQPSNPYVLRKWQACYDGIGKANIVLKNLPLAPDISTSDAARIEGEAKFLRAHFHFELVKVFGVPAFVDENVKFGEYQNVVNDHLIWTEIEDDLTFAYNNLPAVMPAAGRANKWAAGSMLGKVHVFQGEWAAAKTVFDDVIQNGVTSTGAKYRLLAKFGDNFKASTEAASTEMIFAYEASTNDGSIANGNYENTLNQPHGSAAKTGCCGFFQPSQNLVNSYKTAGGVPIPATYNASDLKNDEGLESNEAFAPDAATPLDPRLDWTVGRRGIPFLDWGVHPGKNWVRQTTNGGPYTPKKNVPYLSDYDNQLAANVDWGFVSSAINVQIIRFADVLLLAAEAEAELGNTPKALEYVNLVRNRAANAAGFVQDAAATYQIIPYAAFASPEAALNAIRFERKLELAMEGHRFFDLVRWHNNSGKSRVPFNIVTYINGEYLDVEKTKRPHLANAVFTLKYRYEPIPEYVVTQSTVGGVKNIDQSTEWGGTRSLGE